MAGAVSHRARRLRGGATGARGRLRRVPAELAALLAVAAVLAVAWAVATVPLQGPDESTHVSYTQQLAETGRGPLMNGGKYPISSELEAAMDQLKLRSVVGVLGARPARTALEKERWDERARTITDKERSDGTGPSPLARNPQLYYVYEAVPYLLAGDDLFNRLMLMRLFNAALFVLTVLFTWLLASEVFGRGRDARLRVTLATATVALWPMLTFMGGIVNPDTGLVTAYTALAWLAVRLVRRGPSLGRILALFLVGAACLLVHGRGLAALAVVLAALIVVVLRHRPPRRAMAMWTGVGLAAGVVPLVVSKLALAPGTGGGLYGGEVNIPTQVFSFRGLLSQTWQFYFDRLSFMQPRLGPDYGYRQVVVERFVGGVFGTLEIEYPAWVYDLLQYGIVIVVIALWTAAIVHRRTLLREWPVLVVLGALALGLMTLLHLASYRALVGGSIDPLITGRYLMPLAPLIGLALAWLVGALPRVARAPAAGGLVALLLLMQLGGLGMTFIRFHV